MKARNDVMHVRAKRPVHKKAQNGRKQNCKHDIAQSYTDWSQYQQAELISEMKRIRNKRDYRSASFLSGLRSVIMHSYLTA